MTESIRDLQRKRRQAARVRSDMQSLLAQPLEDPDDEDAAAPLVAPPSRVFVVFHGAKWGDPDGGLKESDSIAGVYATEEAARAAANELRKAERGHEDAWYQPYPVQGM